MLYYIFKDKFKHFDTFIVPYIYMLSGTELEPITSLLDRILVAQLDVVTSMSTGVVNLFCVFISIAG